MKKIFLKHKRFIPLILAFLVAVATGLYFLIKTNTSIKSVVANAVAPSSSTNQPPTYSVFPKIDYRDFYKYLKVKNGLPFIDDDMVARIINYVVVKMQYSGGKLEWSYFFADSRQQTVVILFNLSTDFFSSAETTTKEYTLSVLDTNV